MARPLTLVISRVFDPVQGRLERRGDVYNVARMNRVARHLWEQQVDNLRKAAPTSFRYTSEVALDFSFQVWFHGGMYVWVWVCISCMCAFCVCVQCVVAPKCMCAWRVYCIYTSYA